MSSLVGDTSMLDEPVGEIEAGDEISSPEVSSDAGDVVFRIRAKKFVLQALFEKAGRVVPSKDIMPVLKNFQVRATSDRVTVAATDLELSQVSMSELVEAEIPGTMVFPAKKLLDIIHTAEDEDVMIVVRKAGERLTASVSIGPTVWKLVLESGSDYPDIPEVDGVHLHTIDRVPFLGAIQAVQYAVAKDATRPSLMLVDITDGKFTASDGSRFQQATLPGFPIDAQIPAGAVDDLLALLRTTELATVGVGESDHALIFRVGNDVFIAQKAMTQFPDVESNLLRPALGNSRKLVVDHDELSSAVSRVRINADKETSAIILSLSNGTLEVQSRDKYGNDATEQLSVGWSEGAREIVVNHNYLTDMLKMYDGKSCNFYLGDDTKSRKAPVLLRDEATGAVGTLNQMRADWVTNEQ